MRVTPFAAAVKALILLAGAAEAGSPGSYSYGHTEASGATQGTATVAGFAPAPYIEEPAVPLAQDGLYDDARYGGNQEFGYMPGQACGGLLEGERCLVILGDHMRRVRLEREAATILVGNPAIADVTVLNSSTLFVTARSVGATNIIALDENDNDIATYEVFVREPMTKRVTLRMGAESANFQCAPNCQRALSQTDTPESHSAQAQIITTEFGLDQQAIGTQSGPTPGDAAAAEAAAAQAEADALAGAGNASIPDLGGATASAAEKMMATGAKAASFAGALFGGGAEPSKPAAQPQ